MDAGTDARNATDLAVVKADPEPLVPENINLTTRGRPDEAKMTRFLSTMLPAADRAGSDPAAALVPWLCDVLNSGNSYKAYGRAFRKFVKAMQDEGLHYLDVTHREVKIYKRAMLEGGAKPGTVAQALTVIRGVYKQLAAEGHVPWEAATAIAAIKAPKVEKCTTPSLTNQQAIRLLNAPKTDTLIGIRDKAMLHSYFLTGLRCSALVHARVGDLEHDGVEWWINVTEKRNKKRRLLLLDAARPVLEYIERGGIGDDRDGPLFRPVSKDGKSFERRHLRRQSVWEMVKRRCLDVGIAPDRLDGPGIGVHTLRKSASEDAIRNGATLQEIGEFLGHAQLNTTQHYFTRKDEDAEKAQRKIGIR